MHPDIVTPDRAYLTMTIPLMDANVKGLINIHKCEAFAMGGMSAMGSFPSKKIHSQLEKKNTYLL